MQELKVTFDLVTPMRAPSRPIHLDALLAWAAVTRAGGDISAQEDLPLEKHVAQSGDWCWKASQLQFAKPDLREVIYSCRSFDPWHWGQSWGVTFHKGRGKGALAQGTGPYKGYQFTTPAITVPQVWAFCVGEQDKIEDLLTEVTHVGKLSRLDMGRIKKTTVFPIDGQQDFWMTRTMPDEHKGYRKTWGNIRPPYWKRSTKQVVWEPPKACER